MSRKEKYGIRELRRDFPSDKSCLEYIFESRHSRKCSCGGIYSLRSSRKSFQCSRCRSEIAPAKGTIFAKSSTSLVLWFHALMVFSNAKSGISAKQLERHLAVTYKCAWRMHFVIRSSLVQGMKKLSGIVEADLAYLGGKRKGWKHRSEAILSKPLAMAALERGGEVRTQKVGSTGGKTTTDFILRHVGETARLMTDQSGSFFRSGKVLKRQSVNHSKKEYVRGNVHVNTIESFWSHVKRSLTGIHKSVSDEHLQSYLDAFAFHRNNAHNDRKRFLALLQIVLLAGEGRKIGV